MILRVVATALLIVGLGGCVNPIALASRQQVSLSYVGTFSFGEPARTGRGTVVPLTVDFRTGEWLMHSARVAYGTVARVEDRTIAFSVLTSLPAERGPLVLHLPKLAAGNYAMVYVDPDGARHAVGSIEVGG